ncbi:hypothetical protein ACQ4M4_16460 [Leptolyngbya sp. AN02str]|uniref:hypothetical protein n=1 Tax=Leptolyngbya sp. AN02str TaxID=3423363 RepID=UPI003D319126
MNISVKAAPFISLLLLLGAYSSFSWLLYNLTVPKLAWIMVAIFALGQALLLTTWSQGLRGFLWRWIKSDLGYFSIILLLTISIVFAMVWYSVFEYILLVLATEALARLDLQNAGYNRWQSLFILTVVSALGLAVGWTATFMLPAPTVVG